MAVPDSGRILTEDLNGLAPSIMRPLEGPERFNRFGRHRVPDLRAGPVACFNSQ